MAIHIVDTENFAKLRQKGGCYVDKTGFFEDFLETYGAVTLFTRPGRFGKSLFLSMLAEFFDITRDSRELFAGLKVSENKALCREWMNRSPVISLSLKGVQGADFESALGQLGRLLGAFCLEHDYLCTSPALRQVDRERIAAFCEQRADQRMLEDALWILTRVMSRHHGRRAIVLIDDHEAPLSQVGDRGEQSARMFEFLENFFDSGLKTNRHLEFGVLTGCLPVAWGGLTGGFNNLTCRTVTSPAHAAVFGFTSEEVDRLLGAACLQDRKEELAGRYGGYCFGGLQGLHCPGSLMHALSAAQGGPEEGAGAAAGHGQLLACVGRLRDQARVRSRMAALVAGVPVAGRIDAVVNPAAIFRNERNFWTALYQAGHLTLARDADGCPGLTEAGERLLVIPNGEVREVFRREVEAWLADLCPEGLRQALVSALWARRPRELERQLAALLARCGLEYAMERDVHGVVCALLAMQHAGTTSGKAGPGFCVLVPDREHGRAAVLSVRSAETPERMEEGVRDVLKRLVDSCCDSRLRAEGCGTIFHVGVVFCQGAVRVAFGEPSPAGEAEGRP